MVLHVYVQKLYVPPVSELNCFSNSRSNRVLISEISYAWLSFISISSRNRSKIVNLALIDVRFAVNCFKSLDILRQLQYVNSQNLEMYSLVNEREWRWSITVPMVASDNTGTKRLLRGNLMTRFTNFFWYLLSPWRYFSRQTSVNPARRTKVWCGSLLEILSRSETLLRYLMIVLVEQYCTDYTNNWSSLYLK